MEKIGSRHGKTDRRHGKERKKRWKRDREDRGR